MTLHISNINAGTTQAAINQLFAAYAGARVGKARFISNTDTRVATGYVFAEVEGQADSDDAIAKINGTVLDGNTLKVQTAL